MGSIYVESILSISTLLKLPYLTISISNLKHKKRMILICLYKNEKENILAEISQLIFQSTYCLVKYAHNSTKQ